MNVNQVEILARDCFQHPIYVDKSGKVIEWNFSTKKKSIGFGIFFHTGIVASNARPFNPSTKADTETQAVQRTSLTGVVKAEVENLKPQKLLQKIQSRFSNSMPKSASVDLASVGESDTKGSNSNIVQTLQQDPSWFCILPVKRYHAGKVPFKGRYQATEAGTYVLVFDNSFSRSMSKNLTFWVKIIDNVDQVVQAIEPSMEGWLLKKKRRKNQGFAKRWVTLYNGILSYYMNPTSECRGSISIHASAISVIPEQKLIVVDSGTLVYYFRTMSDQDLEQWVEAIRYYRNSYFQQTISTSNSQQLLASITDVTTKYQLQNIQQQLTNLKATTSGLKSKDSKAVIEVPAKTLEDLLSGMTNVYLGLLNFASSSSRNVSASFQAIDNSSFKLGHRKTFSSNGSVYYDADEDIVLDDDASDISDELSIMPDSPDSSDDDVNEDIDEVPVTAHSHQPSETGVVIGSVRTALPCNMSDEAFSILSFLRKNIGKDLSSVPMPVIVNEPLNLLQRLCEELEYSDLLGKASQEPSSIERIKFIAAFAVSGYASGAFRAGRKPFNPLLGETFEYTVPGKFKFISEKVHHNPHIMACYAESDNYEFWQTNQMKSSFWGKSVDITPIGHLHVKLKKYDETYKWTKVNSHVNVIGTPSIEHYGELNIKNLKTGESCLITFKESTLFYSAKHALQGIIRDADGKEVSTLSGTWSDALYQNLDDSKLEVLWKAIPIPPHGHQQYGFTEFAMNLNHLPSELKSKLPPSDTRFRPDQRLLETGNYEEADELKNKIEAKQRQVRKERETRGQEWKPKWFDKQGEEYVYNGKYWSHRDKKEFESFDLW